MTEKFIMLGRVIEARNQFLYNKKQHGFRQEDEIHARQLCREFGMYEDCGPSYQAGRTEAEALTAYALKIRISSEKHFKKLKRQFLERFPEDANILNSLTKYRESTDMESGEEIEEKSNVD